MKKIINLLLGVIVCACIAGCKDNSIPTDGQLGQLPGIVKKYGDELDALKAKLENSSDTKEMQAIVEKGMAIKKKAEGEVKALADELVGKEIPGEVAQDVPVKILSPFKIKDIRKDGTVQLECEVELTADCGYTPDGSVFNLSNIRVMAVGNDETDAYVHIGGGFRAEKICRCVSERFQGDGLYIPCCRRMERGDDGQAVETRDSGQDRRHIQKREGSQQDGEKRLRKHQQIDLAAC